MNYFYKILNEVYPNTSNEIREILDRLDEAATKDEEISDDKIDSLLSEVEGLELQVCNLNELISDLESELETYINTQD
jgi:hypothetical protein